GTICPCSAVLLWHAATGGVGSAAATWLVDTSVEATSAASLDLPVVSSGPGTSPVVASAGSSPGVTSLAVSGDRPTPRSSPTASTASIAAHSSSTTVTG